MVGKTYVLRIRSGLVGKRAKLPRNYSNLGKGHG